MKAVWLACWLSVFALVHAGGVGAQSQATNVPSDAGVASDAGTRDGPDAGAEPGAADAGPSPFAPLPPMAPPGLDFCVGPSCPHSPTLVEQALAEPTVMPLFSPMHKASRRERYARTSAYFGTVSAALVLGGAIAIAAVDDLQSERITRGIWLGYVATSVPLVAFSVWLAGRESGYKGYAPLRSVGWLAYALAVTNGVLLWDTAIQRDEGSKLLTVASGLLGMFALLPHALDAVSAARGLKMKRIRARLNMSSSGTGLVLKF